MRQHNNRIHNPRRLITMAICKWCGKPFTKTHNRQQYGTTGIHRFYITNNHGESIETTCQQEATKERQRKNSITYYNKHKHDDIYLTPKNHTMLGNSNLTPNPSHDLKVESYLIKKELHRLGLDKKHH